MSWQKWLATWQTFSALLLYLTTMLLETKLNCAKGYIKAILPRAVFEVITLADL